MTGFKPRARGINILSTKTKSQNFRFGAYCFFNSKKLQLSSTISSPSFMSLLVVTVTNATCTS